MTKTRKELLSRDLYLNIVRAHDRLTQKFTELFKSAGVSSQQYNILRILIGGPKEGASCQYVVDRLLTRVPDLTRLVDRMVKSGLVSRTRGVEDRRVVLIRATSKGTHLCSDLDEPVMEIHRAQFESMTSKSLAAMNAGMDEILNLK
ncbi:MAG: DNA-binding MarR family transcriptional regulator [Planctomycetota bacterium]|jgi:DNA-binding MarR family transcriptional regulator